MPSPNQQKRTKEPTAAQATATGIARTQTHKTRLMDLGAELFESGFIERLRIRSAGRFAILRFSVAGSAATDHVKDLQIMNELHDQGIRSDSPEKPRFPLDSQRDNQAEHRRNSDRDHTI